MSKAAATGSSSRSEEITNAEKWDHAVECGLRRTTMGFALGVLPALLFARGWAARSAVTMFTAGLGAGTAYGEARYLFDHNIVFDKRHFFWFEESSVDGSAATSDALKP